MEVQIVTLPAVHVVGMQIHTSPMAPDIAALWPQFTQRMPEIRHCTEMGVSYGVMDNLSMADNSFDYLAGNPVTAIADIPAGMHAWTIPAGRYVWCTCTLATIPQAFDFIYNTWIHTSGYQLAPGPCYEYYGVEFKHAHDGKLAIVVPITPA